jgi:hypothetical protein
VLFEFTGGATTRPSFSHMHFFHEKPLCAANWYVEHLGMELPPVREQTVAEAVRRSYQPCDVAFGEAGGRRSSRSARFDRRRGSVRFTAATCRGTRASVRARAAARISRSCRRADSRSITSRSLSPISMLLRKASRRRREDSRSTAHAFGDTRAFMIEDPDGLAIEIVAKTP